MFTDAGQTCSLLPGADGRTDLAYLSTDGNVYPNYPLAPTTRAAGTATPTTAGKAGWSSTTSARGNLDRHLEPGGLVDARLPPGVVVILELLNAAAFRQSHPMLHVACRLIHPAGP